MDRIDKKILDVLQHDSSTSNQELADQVSLSPSPCSRRVKLLEEQGYIDKYVALLNPDKLGLQLNVIVMVGLDSHEAKKMKSFEKKIQTFPEVVTCFLITGHSADYLLRVVSTNLEEYQHFLLNKLTCIEGVSNVQSSFVLRSITNDTTLPLTQLD